ncbi:MAG: tRNA (N6-isopentenyl adenosine(37)-C2)-methylthiotransferase MiaB [Ignavibacteriae bacterium]|nr:tRNA (N6-isopentenyl adenosine(37)-C2)-methylthiotransferase MiaB [Ignavibacteriota bacterium]
MENNTNTYKKDKVYIETYGCQMNFSDTEIVSSILINSGFSVINNPDDADAILLNTCSVRDNAERKIHERLIHLKKYKKQNKELVVGILGCMAERLRNSLIEEKQIVDLVVGPDEFRKVPQLIEDARHGTKGIAVKLSRVETYDDIEPLHTSGVFAWLSIMRGCDNFCSYCVVPYTRGRERSRGLDTVVREVENLNEKGFKEITLLGQNVNSYKDRQTGEDFADLLAACAKATPEIRFRYMTSHPMDMSDKLIETMTEYDNICKYIHLPVQSGSNRILDLMLRGYTVEHYLGRIKRIKELMPGCSLSTDIIAGFPTETEEDHQQTLRVIEEVGYDGAFMFKYSPREHTKALAMEDDVPDKEKTRRLNEIIELQHKVSRVLNEKEIGRTHTIVAESPSKKNPQEWMGRTDTNKVVVFPSLNGIKEGDVFKVNITGSTSATLFGEVV